MGQVTVAASSRSCPPGVRDLFVFPSLELGPEISGAAFAMKPRSQGSVRLNGPDPETPLAIDHGFLRDERDVEVLAEGFEAAARARGLARGSAVRGRRAAAGEDVGADEHARATARGFFHPVGTCAIGSVLDERCRVLGFENLVRRRCLGDPGHPASEHEPDHGRARRARGRPGSRIESWLRRPGRTSCTTPATTRPTRCSPPIRSRCSIGFALDQQVPVPTAFQGPLKLKQRLGTLDPGQIAATDPARLEEVFREKPAIHRFPGNMARRVQDLALMVVEDTAATPSASGARRRRHRPAQADRGPTRLRRDEGQGTRRGAREALRGRGGARSLTPAIRRSATSTRRRRSRSTRRRSAPTRRSCSAQQSA